MVSNKSVFVMPNWLLLVMTVFAFFTKKWFTNRLTFGAFAVNIKLTI